MTKTKTKIKLLILAALALLGFFIMAKIAKAADTDIVINEIGAYEKSENEWLEIFNKGSEQVDLTGWKFYEDKTNHKLSAFQVDFIIDPQEYAVIANVAANFKNLYPDFSGTILDSSWSSLKEDGEEIGLKNSKGETIEDFTYLPCPQTSLQRIDPAINDYTETNWQVHQTSNSAGQQNEFSSENNDNGGDDTNSNSSNNTEENQSSDEEQSDSTQTEQEQTNDQSTDEQTTSDTTTQSTSQDTSANTGTTSSQTSDTTTTAQTTTKSKSLKIVSSGTVVINEFVSDPADGEVEWIELYNKNSFDIDLTGWKILDGSEAVTNLSGTLGSNYDNRFFVVEKPKGKLNNSGDAIILKDGQNNIIDAVYYGNWDSGFMDQNAPMAKDPNSTARIFDGAESFNNNADFVVTQTPTKGTANVITLLEDDKAAKKEADQKETETETQANLDKNIIINEIYPNPPGSDLENEFIELKNIGDQDIDLTGWKISNSSKMSFKITKENFDSAILKPNGFLVIERKISGLALDNKKDTVKLINADAKTIQTAKYSEDENVPENVSYVPAENSDWVWTTTPTRGQENIIDKLNHAPEISFDCPKTAQIGEEYVCDASDSYDLDNDDLSFRWQIENQETDEPIVSHTFAQKGSFVISLIVSDGKNETTEEQKIKVSAPETDSPAVSKTTTKKTTKTSAKKTNKNTNAISQASALEIEGNNQSSNILKYLITSSIFLGLGAVAVIKKKKKIPNDKIS